MNSDSFQNHGAAGAGRRNAPAGGANAPAGGANAPGGGASGPAGAGGGYDRALDDDGRQLYRKFVVLFTDAAGQLDSIGKKRDAQRFRERAEILQNGMESGRNLTNFNNMIVKGSADMVEMIRVFKMSEDLRLKSKFCRLVSEAYKALRVLMIRNNYDSDSIVGVEQVIDSMTVLVDDINYQLNRGETILRCSQRIIDLFQEASQVTRDMQPPQHDHSFGFSARVQELRRALESGIDSRSLVTMILAGAKALHRVDLSAEDRHSRIVLPWFSICLHVYEALLEYFTALSFGESEMQKIRGNIEIFTRFVQQAEVQCKKLDDEELMHTTELRFFEAALEFAREMGAREVVNAIQNYIPYIKSSASVDKDARCLATIAAEAGLTELVSLANSRGGGGVNRLQAIFALRLRREQVEEMIARDRPGESMATLNIKLEEQKKTVLAAQKAKEEAERVAKEKAEQEERERAEREAIEEEKRRKAEERRARKARKAEERRIREEAERRAAEERAAALAAKLAAMRDERARILDFARRETESANASAARLEDGLAELEQVSYQTASRANHAVKRVSDAEWKYEQAREAMEKAYQALLVSQLDYDEALSAERQANAQLRDSRERIEHLQARALFLPRWSRDHERRLDALEADPDQYDPSLAWQEGDGASGN